MASRHVVIDVDMPDGSKVLVSALLSKPAAAITERDRQAIRECIHAISATRMDPKRAERKALQERRSRCIGYEDDGQGSALCLNCGEPRHDGTSK